MNTGTERSALLSAAILGLALLLASCGPVFDRPAVTNTLVTSDPQLVQGERTFYTHCHGCHPHGGRGLGKGVTDRPLPTFAVRLQIRNGFGEMPAFSEEEIGPEEMDALLSYLEVLREFWANEGS